MVAQVLLRATVLLLLALAVAVGLRRAAAMTRRLLWAGTLLALLILPVLTVLAPPLPLRILARPPPAPIYPPPGATPVTSPIAPPVMAAPPAPRSIDWWLVAYVSGVLVSLAGLGRARLRAHRSLQGAAPAGPEWAVPPGVDARESETVALPRAVGTFRPVILLPRGGRSWPEAARRAVLAHEVAHVRRHDPLWQLLAEVVRTLYWFHPLVHLAARQLRVERELAADDHALHATGIAPRDYARLLFDLACLPESPPQLGAVVPLLTPGGLKTRLLSILDERRPRRERGSIALAVLGLASLGAVATVVPVVRAAAVYGHGPLIARIVQDGRPAAGVEVSVRPEAIQERTTGVLSDARGEVHYPDDLPPAHYYNVYARRGIYAARQGVMDVKYGTKLPIEMVLRPALSVSGTAREPDGRPIAGATVIVDEDERYSPGPGRVILARSDRQGHWKAEGLMYGHYWLRLQAPWGVATALEVHLQDRDVSDLDARLGRDWPVTGVAQDQAGHRMAGVRVDRVDLYRISLNPRVANTVTRLAGERHLDWDETGPDGSFRLLPRKGTITGAVVRPDGTALYGQTNVFPGPGGSVLTLAPPAKLSGVLRDRDGKPVRGARMTAAHPFFDFVSGNDGYTDDRGRFVLIGPPVSQLIVLAQQPGQFGRVDRFTVKPADGLDLKLP